MLLWRPLCRIVIIPAVVLGSSCSAPPVDVVEPASTDIVRDLLDQGFSLEVSSCVAGFAETSDTLESHEELIDACTRASALLHQPESPPSTLPMGGPTSYGDDTTLDALWDACAGGDGTACDELWESSPVGSEYEEFGVTCGNRPAVLDCGELVDGHEPPTG